MPTRKLSLVENITKRKKAGTTRPTPESTVSEKPYTEMRKGWPKSHRARTSPGRRKRRARR
jgi:hypothetical protein